MLEISISTELLAIAVLVGIFELVFKSIALWKSAKNNHLVWFICLLLLNTVGILPIIYILAFSKKKVSKKSIKKVSKKRR